MKQYNFFKNLTSRIGLVVLTLVVTGVGYVVVTDSVDDIFIRDSASVSENADAQISQVPVDTEPPYPQDGPPCTAGRDPTGIEDIYQDNRVIFDVPPIAPGDGVSLDIIDEYIRRCLRGRASRDEIVGGFSDATIEMDILELTNTFDTKERAEEYLGIEEDEPSLELALVAVYDVDTSSADTTPNALSDFPFSCNTIYTRRAEGGLQGGSTIRLEDRATMGAYCCENGWGTSEYLDNPPDSRSGGSDPNAVNNRSPEPDDDGDGRNGYTGTMTGHYTFRWGRVSELIDSSFEEIPATELEVTIDYIIDWPGLLYRRVTPPGVDDIQFYRDNVVGTFIDAEKGNGEYDEGLEVGDCDVPASKDFVQPLPEEFWQPPDDNPDWVRPLFTRPCPPATPEYGDDGNYAWVHSEPFRDDNGNGEWDEGEPFDDIGNGYFGPNDQWVYTAPPFGMRAAVGNQISPELTFNGQRIDIARSPLSDRVVGDRHDRLVFYPIENIEVRGYFKSYTQTECTCRPDDVNTSDDNVNEEGIGLSGDGRIFEGCQATFSDQFFPQLCGYCGANQPFDTTGVTLGEFGDVSTGYPPNVYCEDTINRAETFRWPPFTLDTKSLDWEISSNQLGRIFDVSFDDQTTPPQVQILTAPRAPRKGETVQVSALPINFFSSENENYYAWLLNDRIQQGLVAGATERVPETGCRTGNCTNYDPQPPFIEILPEGGTAVRPDPRTFYEAPSRKPDVASDPNADTDFDGMEDGWERRYFGNLSEEPLSDPDDDGHIPEDYSNQRTSQFAVNPASGDEDNVFGQNPTYEQIGRFMHIVPGVWWKFQNPAGNDIEIYIPPENYNPEWFDPDVVSDQYVYADGYSNIEEYIWGTDPTDPDTDDDGYADGVDISGVGQSQWNYVNPYTRNDGLRDKIGVIAMGFQTNANEDDQRPYSQIICNSKVIYPTISDKFALGLSFDPLVVIPGEDQTITATVSNANVREGFLSYEWIVNGGSIVPDVPNNGQGQSSITIPASETATIDPGSLFNVKVIAINKNQTQESFGELAEIEESIPVGVPLETIVVSQAGNQVFPPAVQPDADTSDRYEYYLDTLKKNIDINRIDPVSIALTAVDDIDNLYFEWIVDGVSQQEDSGKGGSFSSYTFEPKWFLPNGLDLVNSYYGKALNVVVRGVDVRTQEEILRVGLNFKYEPPAVDITSDSAPDNQEALLLHAEPENFGNATRLFYSWKIDGETIYEGENLRDVTLSYQQASVARAVELVVSGIDAPFEESYSIAHNIDIFSFNVPWYEKVSLVAWRVYSNVPHYSEQVIKFFFLLNAICFVFFVLYMVSIKRVNKSSLKNAA